MENDDKELTYHQKWYLKNKERILARQKEYYNNNSKKIRAQNRKTYQEENKENYRIWHMSWREIPKNRIKESVMKAKNTGHKRGHVFEERLFELVENPPTHCKCCFKELDYSVGNGAKRHSMSPTLDRLDNTRGYTFENTFIICRRCNTIKSDATFEDIKNFYNYMQLNRPQKDA
jgi:hypothetical protein